MSRPPLPALAGATPAGRLEQARTLLWPRLNRYIPVKPTPHQAALLLFGQVAGMRGKAQALYGGAAGGGKTIGLLIAGLQYVDVPGYAAIIFRRKFTDLALPGAPMAVAEEWLRGTDAKWDETTHTWTFPSGSTLSFGYLEKRQDRFRYQGAAFQFIGFDELTQHEERNYRYLFSRLRRPAGSTVPLRMFATSNPGGIGHEWVKRWFLIEGAAHGRVFIPAKRWDNPYLDQEAYSESLKELPPVEREQLEHGNWDAVIEGSLFKREWWRFADAVPAGARRVRRWDLAATEAKADTVGNDPDWTVGVRMARDDEGRVYVEDVVRLRGTPLQVERAIRATAERDGREVPIRLEQEPGSSGKTVVDHYVRTVLAGWDVRGVPSTGDKRLRMRPYSAQVQAGNVYLLRGPWNTAYIDEGAAIGTDAEVHDDQMDASAAAYQDLTAYTPLECW